MSSVSRPPASSSPQPPAHHKHGIVIAGLDQPQTITDLLREHPPEDSGFQAPIYVLETDKEIVNAYRQESSALDWPERVHVFAGEDCVEQFLEMLRTQLDCWLPRHIVATGHRTVDLARTVAARLDLLVKEQTDLIEETRSRIASRWEDRGMAYWASRYAEIREGARARVLISTTRFSTFMKHAAQDLAEAMEADGHQVRLLIEPNTSTGITPLLCLEAIESFDPDLVVVINFPRSMHADLFPDGCPHVCWVQDAMGHLFKQGQPKPSPMDFIVGHIYTESSLVAGYADDALLSFPVPVSQRKFHCGPVSDELAQRYTCDIAYVSHQSATPSAFHKQFVREFPIIQQAAFERARDAVIETMSAWSDSVVTQQLHRISGQLAHEMTKSDDKNIKNLLFKQYINPIAERIIRHQTLEWAAEIARTHQLDFRIFGKGWEHHPSLHSYAAGEIEHGDALRACYQSAKVHLHASVNGCGHQRIFECACSGGLILCRRSWGEVYRQNRLQMSDFMRQGLPADASLVEWKCPAYLIEKHPQLKAIMNDRARIKTPTSGWDHDLLERILAGTVACETDESGNPHLVLYAQIANDERFSHRLVPSTPQQMRPLEILGDPLELTFSTSEELEERILKAIHDPTWRSARSTGIADRVRERVSMSRFGRELIALVINKLSEPHAAELSEAGA